MARECVNEYLETVGGQIRWRRARRLLLRELSDHIADQAAAFEAEGRSPARECVNEYLETVGGQIRWRRARRLLLRELSDHIADQAAAFEAEGRSPEEALAGAVAEMGEPEAVGRELDRLHRPRNRWGLAVTVAALFAAGVLLQLFAAGLMGDAKDVFYFRRQVLGLLLAAGVLTGLWFSDYTLLLRRKWVPAAAGLMGDAKDVFYFRRQVLGLLLAAGVLTGLWFSDYTLLLRRKWVPAAALLLLCLGPILCTPLLPFYSYHGYQLALYPTLLLPVPYAALVVSLRGRGTRAVLLCGGLALPLPIWAFVAVSSTGYLVTLASMLLVLLAAVGLGWFRGKLRWNLLAALGPALAIPLYFLRHLEYAAWRIDAFLGPDLFYERLRMGELPSLFVGSSPELLLAEAAQGLGRWVFWGRIDAFLGPDLFYERLRMGELPSLFVGSSPELLLAEAAQGLGRWVFWAAAGLIVLFAALLLRRIRALHSRTGKLLALSAFLPLFLQAAIYWLYNLGWWPLGVLSLPFLSYGVFFLLVDAALAALSAFLPLFLQAAIYWLYNLGWWPLGVLSLPFLSYGVFFLLVDAALAGVLLSVFRMDALVRDTAWASRAPAPRPSALDIPLGRGQLHIEYRKGAQHF